MDRSMGNASNGVRASAHALFEDLLLKLVLMAAVVAALADGAVSLNGF